MPNNNNPILPQGGTIVNPTQSPLAGLGATGSINLPYYKTLNHYDKGLTDGMNQEYNRADNQAWYQQIGNTLVGRTLSVVPKIGAGIGAMYGIGDAITNQDMSKVWDNPVSNFFQAGDDELRNMFPNYKSKQYTEGNLFAKLTTLGVLDDMADAAAFMGAAYLSGVPVMKGTGALMQSLSEAKTSSKALQKTLQYIGGSSEAAKDAVAIAKGGDRTAQFATTLYNTISESAVEAHQSFDELTKLHLEKDPSLSTEEAKAKARAGSSSVFGLNMLALMAPNFLETVNMHGGLGANVKLARQMQREGKPMEEFLSAGNKWNKAGVSALSEGAYEENIQSAIQTYERQVAEGKKDASIIENFGKNLAGFVKELIPGVGTTKEETDAALAILLGGLMGAGGAFKSHISESKQLAGLAENIVSKYNLIRNEHVPAMEALLSDRSNSTLKTFVDENGKRTKINPKTGKEELNPTAVLNGIINHTRNKSFFEASTAATASNDNALHTYNVEMAKMAYAHDLATQYSDEEDLKDHLAILGSQAHTKDVAPQIQEYVDLYNKVTADSASIEDFTNEETAATFNQWYKSLVFYTEAKGKALEKLKETAKPESIAAIDKLIGDNFETSKVIKDQKSILKEDFLRERNPYEENASKSKDQSLSPEARKGHTYLSKEGTVINKGWSDITPSVDTPGLRYQSEYESGRQALLDYSIENFPDEAHTEAEDFIRTTKHAKLTEKSIDALIQVRDKELEALQEVEDQLQEIDAKYTEIDEDDTIADPDAARAALEPTQLELTQKALGIQAKINRLDSLVRTSANRNFTQPKTESALQRTFFAEYVENGIKRLNEAMERDPNGFEDSGALNVYQDNLNAAREAYKIREDISEKMRETMLKRIETLQALISDMLEQVQKNSGNRALKQKMALNTSVESLEDILNIPSVKELISKYVPFKDYEDLQSTLLNDGHSNLHGLELLLFKLRDTVKDEDLEKLKGLIQEHVENSKEELFKSIEKRYSAKAYSKSDRTTLYTRNPDKVIGTIIRKIYEKNLPDRIDEYLTNRDLDSLIFDLPVSKLSQGDQEALREMYAYHNKVKSGQRLLKFYLGSKLNFGKVLEAKALLAKNLSDSNFAPTFQQTIAINQILEHYFTKDSEWGNVAVSLGLAGTGKSSMVASTVVSILTKLDPKFNVYAVGHTEQSSKNINELLGTKVTSLADLSKLTEKELEAIDLLIIDEAFGISNTMVEAIVSKAKNKILLLGDPAQSSIETLHSIDRAVSSDATYVQPLTVVYRTNVPSIVEYFSKFRLKNKEVQSPEALVNLSMSSILADPSKAVGVTNATVQEIEQALNVPSSRTRALVVSNAEDLAKYSTLKGVDVYMYNTVQGLTYDEVYTLINKDHFDNSEGFKSYNQAVFTATSRARFFVMSNGQETKTIESPTISPNVEIAKEEFSKNKGLYIKELENASEFLKLLNGTSITISAPSAAVATPDPLMRDEDEEDVSYEESIAHLQPSVIDAENLAEEKERDIPQVATSGEHRILQFPTNSAISKWYGDGENAQVKIDDDVYVLRVDKEGTLQYHLMALPKDGLKANTPISIAVLDGLDWDVPEFASLQKEGNPNKRLPYGYLNTLTAEDLKQQSIGKFKVSLTKPAQFSYNKPLEKNDNAIEETLKKFISDYFSTVSTPDGISFFDKGGNLNYNALKKHGVRVVIFKKGSSKKGGDESITYPETTSKAPVISGVPYIEFPTAHTTEKGKSRRNFYIRLSANKFSKKSQYYAPIKELYDTLKELAAQNELLNFENPDFRKAIVDPWASNFEVTTIVDPEGNSYAITKKSDAKTLAEVFPKLKVGPETEALLDKLILLTHGYKNVEYKINVAEYETFKLSLEKENIIVTGHSKPDAAGRVKIEIQTDLEDTSSIEFYKKRILSTSKASSANALNALANANSYLAGTKFVTEKKFKDKDGNEHTNRMARAIFKQDSTKGGYISWLRAAYMEVLQNADFQLPNGFESLNQFVERTPFKDREQTLLDYGGMSQDELDEKKKQYSVPPINFERLEQLVGDESFDENGEHKTQTPEGYYLREPLIVRGKTKKGKSYGVNEWGSDLSNAEYRQQLSEQLTSRFSGYTSTTIGVQSVNSIPVSKPKPTISATQALSKLKGPVADALRQFDLSDVQIKYDPSIPEKHARFDGENIVYNGEVDMLTPPLLLHELIHAATIEGIVRTMTNQDPSAKDIELTKRLKELSTLYKAKFGTKGLVDSPSLNEGELGYVTEFIANLSNPEFKKNASSIKIKKANLLEEIWTAILDFLGVNTNVYEATLQTLIAYSQKTTIPVSTIKSLVDDLKLAELPKGIDPEEYAEFLVTVFPKSFVRNIVWHAGSVNRLPEYIPREEYERLKKLHEAGKLSDDKTVGDYAPDASEAEIFAKMHKSVKDATKFDPSTIGSSGFSGLYALGAGFYFGTRTEAEDYGYPRPYLINIENPTYTSSKGFQSRNEAGKLIFVNKDKGNDGVINDVDTFKGEIQEYVVFDDSQIHYIGGEESLKQFKKFKASNKPNAEKEALIAHIESSFDEETAEHFIEQVKVASDEELKLIKDSLGFAFFTKPVVTYTSVFGGINKSRYISSKHLTKPSELSVASWEIMKNILDRILDKAVYHPEILESFYGFEHDKSWHPIGSGNKAWIDSFFSFINSNSILDRSDRAYLKDLFGDDYISTMTEAASTGVSALSDKQLEIVEAIFNLPEILQQKETIKDVLTDASSREIELYRKAKSVLLSTLEEVSATSHKVSLFPSKYLKAVEESITLKRATLLTKPGISTDKAVMLEVYGALLAKSKGKARLVLHDVYDSIFPNKGIKEDEDEIFDRDIATKEVIGIKEYVQDAAYVDGSKSLSQSIKEFLTFTKYTDESGKLVYLNPAFAYFRTLELMEQLHLSRLSAAPLKVQLDSVLGTSELSPAVQAIVDKLQHLATVATATHTKDGDALPTNLTFSSKYNVKGEVIYSVRYNKEDSPYFNDSIDLYNWILSKDSGVTIAVYNGLFAKYESQNTLREMQNQLGSQRETDLYVGSREYNAKKKGHEFKYFKTKDFGISSAIEVTIANALLQAVVDSKLSETSTGLKAYLGSTVMTKLNSKILTERKEAIRAVFDKMGLSSLKSVILPADSHSISAAIIGLESAYAEYWRSAKGSSTILTEDGDSTTDEIPKSTEEFLEEQSSRLKTIASALEKASQFVRNPSVLDGKGNKYFKHHNSSWAYFVIKDLIRSREFAGSPGKDYIPVPDYLKTDFFKLNPFVDGICKIHDIIEHDSLKQETTGSVINNQRESEKWFYHREFHMGFLAGIRANNNRYFQFFSPPSDKPKVPAGLVSVLSIDDAVKGIKSIIKQIQFTQEQPSLGYQNYDNSRKTDPFRNFKVLERALQGSTTEEKLKTLSKVTTEEEMNALVDRVKLELDVLAQEFKKRDTILHTAEKGGVSRKLVDYRTDEIFEKHLQPLLGADDTTTDMYRLFMYNRYVNSYGMNQLVVGDYNMFKNTNDIIKRMAGIFGPGTIGLVHPKMGMKETFKVAIINDTSEDMFAGEVPTSVVLRELLGEMDDETKVLIKKALALPEGPERSKAIESAVKHNLSAKLQNDLDSLLLAFGNSGYESTDGQGFMSEKRARDLNKGFGRAWNAGNIMKPMYYGVRAERRLYDTDKVADAAVPVYLKYSTIVLTEDLVSRFPTLRPIKERMEAAHGPDEVIFKSAVKVGVPNGIKTNFKTFATDDLTNSTLVLPNEHFRLQHNPAHSIDQPVTIFTQLMYFLSMLGTNDVAAQQTYQFVADIMNTQLTTWEGKTDKLKEFIANKLNAKGNERAYQLFKHAVSLNNPLIEKKAITLLASSLEGDVIKTKFEGSKLVLQSAEGIAKYQDTALFGETKSKAEKLSFKLENGRLVAECIVPRGLLTEEQLKMVAKKQPIFITGDMLGYRIPSTELHSAVALRVVGVYDQYDTNMVIVPKEIVAIHGSDFDVDALYVIKKEVFQKATSPIALKDFKAFVEAIKYFDAKHLEVSKTLTAEQYTVYSKLYNKHIVTKPYSIKQALEGYSKFSEELSTAGLSHADFTGKFDLVSITNHHYKLNSQGKGDPIGYVYTEEGWKFDDTKLKEFEDLRTEYSTAAENLDEDYQKMMEQQIKAIDKLIIAFKRNSITETFLETITHEKNRMRMLTPISFTTFKDLIKYLAANGLASDYSEARDLSNPMDTWKVQESLSSGAILTGASAYAVKVVAYASRGGSFTMRDNKDQSWQEITGFTDEQVSHLVITEDIKSILSEEYSKKQMSKSKTSIKTPFLFKVDGKNQFVHRLRFTYLGSDKSTLDTFDGTINIAIDNLKLQYLPQLNINQNTGSAWFGGLMLGMPDQDLATLLAHPILKEVSSYKYSSTLQGLSDLLNKYEDEAKKKAESFVFSSESLLNAAQNNSLQLETLIFFKRLYTIGEDMRKLATFLDIIRMVPTDVEGIEKVRESLKAIGEVDEKGVIKVNKDFTINVPNLIINTPHVAAAWKAFTILEAKIEKEFLLHSKPAKKFAEDLKLGALRRKEDDSTDQLVALRRELYKFYAAEVYADQINATPIREKRVGPRSFPLSRTTSWNQKLLEELKKLQSYVLATETNPAKIRFINSLVITGNSTDMYKMRMAAGANITDDDIRELEEGFEYLKDFSIEKGKIIESPNSGYFTEALVVYGVLNFGLNFGSTNYSQIIPASRVKIIDEQINNLLTSFVKDDTERERIKEYFKISVIAQNGDNLQFLKTSVFEGHDNKLYIGKMDGIYYDRAIDISKYRGEYGEESSIPTYFKIGSFNSANSYIRLESDSKTHAFYQKVGKTSDTYYSPLTGSYTIADRFNPSIFTAKFLGDPAKANGKTFDTYDRLDNLVGDTIYISPYYDFARQDRKKVKIDSIQEIGDNKYRVSYTDVVEAPPAPRRIRPGQDLGYASLENIADKYKDRVTDNRNSTIEEVREFKVDGVVYPTITAQINKQRKYPYTNTESIAEKNANRLWENQDPSKLLEFTRLSAQPINKEQYIALETAELEKAAIKGTIIHKYVQFIISKDPKAYQEAVELTRAAGYPDIYFSYLLDTDNIQKLKNKFNMTDKDSARSEVVLGSKELGLFGTADLLVEHEDGTFSIFDIKTSRQFNRLNESDIFRYGRTSSLDIYTSKRNTAKLQVLWYAILAKYENPSMKFKSLEVTHIPNEEYLSETDPNRKVEVNAFMEMLVNYLKNEDPELYAKLNKVDNIFDVSHYSVNPKEAKYSGDVSTAQILKLKSLELQRLVMYEQDLSILTSKDVEDKRAYVKKKIAKLLQEIVNIRGNKYIDYSSTSSDISWMESWLGSASSSTNPHIQLYYTFLREQKQEISTEIASWRATHTKLINAMRVSMGLGTGIGKGLIGGTDHKTLFKPILEEVMEGGRVINHKVITEKSAGYARLNEAQKAYVKFFNDSVGSVFVDELSNMVNPETGKKEALANKVVIIKKGKTKEHPYTNLDLAAGADFRTSGAKFKYYEGFLPKTLKTGQEIRDEFSFFSKKAFDYFKTKLTTNWFEHQFDKWGAKEEAIPMKYLDDRQVLDEQEYSLNLEQSLDAFMSHHIYKAKADDVYAMGKAMKVYLELQESKDNNINYSNLKDWFDANISLTLLGKREDDLQFSKRPWRTRSKPNENGTAHLKKLNWAKVLRSMMSFFSGPTMWLKPTGLVNGIFINLYTYKEALKNTLTPHLGFMKGIDGNSIQFGVKDLVKAHGVYLDMVKDQMTGKLHENKTWILMNKFKYLPDNYDFATEHNNLMTGKNKLFSTKLMFLFHSIPEEMLTATIMVAQMSSMKTKGVSVWDRYVKNEINGVVDYVWDGTSRGLINVSKDANNPEYVQLGELTPEELNKLRYVYERMHGGYRSDERTRLEYYALGQVFMQFKKYMPSVLRNAFQSKGQSMTLGNYFKTGDHDGQEVFEWKPAVVEGRWPLLIKTILHAFQLRSVGKRAGEVDNESYSWDQLSDQQKQDLWDAMLSVVVFGIMFLGYAAAVPPKDANKQVPKYIRRIYNDMVQQYNILEIGRNVVMNPPPIGNHFFKLLESSFTLSVSAFYLSTGADSEKYETQKGEFRGWNEFQGHIHGLASYKAWNRLVTQLEDDEPVFRTK